MTARATVDIVVPQVGEALSEVTIVRWLKEVGDHVERGEVLFEVDTEKATVEVEAFADGTLTQILLRAGSPAQPQERAGLLEPDAPETISADGATAPHDPAAAPLEAQRSPDGSAGESTRPRQSDRARATPRARALARTLGVDLGTVQGTGNTGLITAQDVERASTNAAAPPAAPLTDMRSAIARRMTASKRSVPHFYMLRDVDMAKVERHREQAGTSAPGRKAATITSYVVTACARALARMPSVNVSYSDDGLVRRSRVGVGVAVALDDGLVVPVVVDADALQLQEVDERVRGLAERARAGRLAASDFDERSIVVSNLGSAGVDAFLAIIDEPDPAIVSVGRISERYVKRGSEEGFRPICTLGLSVDHRALNGMEAARFLDLVAQELEGFDESGSADD